MEDHLDGWVRDIADQRVHGTTGEVSIEGSGAGGLRSVVGIPALETVRELVRR